MYSTQMYTTFVQETITTHVTTAEASGTAVAPFFFYLAFQTCHGPLEVPHHYMESIYGEEFSKQCKWADYKLGRGEWQTVF
jgi:hypothetical protein